MSHMSWSLADRPPLTAPSVPWPLAARLRRTAFSPVTDRIPTYSAWQQINADINGISVGSGEQFTAMNEFLTAHLANSFSQGRSASYRTVKVFRQKSRRMPACVWRCKAPSTPVTCPKRGLAASMAV